MARFEFAAPTQIVFGEGVLNEVADLASGFGERALITSGLRGEGLTRLVTLLASRKIASEVVDVPYEPSITSVLEGLRQSQATGCSFVIGFGGGSAIDTGKAISALMTNPGDPLDYLEVVGKNQPLRQRSAPFIAIPTTAGTGSEVTRNAVLAVPEKGTKVSLRSPLMMARVALVDPELTYDLPPEITASTGMDALAQVIEPYVSKRATAMTNLYSREGIRQGSRALLSVYQSGKDQSARAAMAFTSLMGGLALANAGLGAVHGFAGPIGGMFKAPHGAVCAVLLPPVVDVNVRAMLERDPQNPALDRYREIYPIMTGQDDPEIINLVVWLENLRAGLHIPGLSSYGVTEQDIPILVDKSTDASSMKANPVKLNAEEMAEILRRAL